VWRGRPLPVVDLGVLLVGTPVRPVLSSRVIVVQAPHPLGGRAPMGLLAERVTDVEAIDERSLASSGLELPDAPYLGPVFRHGPNQQLYQLITLDRLVPPGIRELLVRE
jgi:chemotaxis-related protein WspB